MSKARKVLADILFPGAPTRTSPFPTYAISSNVAGSAADKEVAVTSSSTEEGVEEILNVQPLGNKAKAYQVKQVRNLILKYQPEID